MVPYHRFLLALMVANTSNSDRLGLLEDMNCFGMDSNSIQRLFRSLSDHPDVDGELAKHFEAQSKGKMLDNYVPHKHAVRFCTSQGITHILHALTNQSSGNEAQALSLMCRPMYWRIMVCLFLCESTPENVAEAIEFRFGKVIDPGVFEQAYYMFFQFGSMKQREISAWVSNHTQRVRQLLLIAQNEPAYVVRDELGISGDIDLKYVSQRIMARSLSKFEMLSTSGHKDAMYHARDWGKLAMTAGVNYEKVKGGGFVDFIAQFQIALTEADDSMITAHSDSEFPDSE